MECQQKNTTSKYDKAAVCTPRVGVASNCCSCSLVRLSFVQKVERAEKAQRYDKIMVSLVGLFVLWVDEYRTGSGSDRVVLALRSNNLTIPWLTENTSFQVRNSAVRRPSRYRSRFCILRPTTRVGPRFGGGQAISFIGFQEPPDDAFFSTLPGPFTVLFTTGSPS
jgi:hypothetical protein